MRPPSLCSSTRPDRRRGAERERTEQQQHLVEVEQTRGLLDDHPPSAKGVAVLPRPMARADEWSEDLSRALLAVPFTLRSKRSDQDGTTEQLLIVRSLCRGIG